MEPRDLSPGQVAELTFGARDEQGNTRSDVTYEAEVITPDRKSRPLVTRRNESGGIAEFTETAESGDYWVQVKAIAGGQPVAGPAITRFHVNTRDPELDVPAADSSLLRELAHVSGGDFLTSDELLTRLETWAAKGLPGMELERTERMTLWDNWIVICVVVLLLTAEWIIRKKRGLV